jgi:enoyl-CoA hydratase
LTELVTLSVSEAVARVTLDRPEKMDAMTPELARLCRQVGTDESVRVVVITGAGSRAFSAGSDIGKLTAKPGPWAIRNRVEYAREVRNIRKPAIAALCGWVFGGGLEMAIVADIRIAARRAKLGTPEVTRGWLGCGGASQMLPRLIGYGGAMMMMLLGEPVDVETALRMGLVEAVVDDEVLLQHTDWLAAKIVSYSSIATQSVKAATRMAVAVPFEAGLMYENGLHSLVMQSHEQAEGIAAFQQRRAGAFDGHDNRCAEDDRPLPGFGAGPRP